jgi:hypothetical protein
MDDEYVVRDALAADEERLLALGLLKDALLAAVAKGAFRPDQLGMDPFSVNFSFEWSSQTALGVVFDYTMYGTGFAVQLPEEDLVVIGVWGGSSFEIIDLRWCGMSWADERAKLISPGTIEERRQRVEFFQRELLGML